MSSIKTESDDSLNIVALNSNLIELINGPQTANSQLKLLETLKTLTKVNMTAKDLIQLQLGKRVNVLRKSTKNSAIGSECRKLIIKWRGLIIKSDTTESVKEQSITDENASSDKNVSSDKNASSDKNFQTSPTNLGKTSPSFSYEFIKKNLNFPDFSEFSRIPSVDIPDDLDIDGFLEKDVERYKPEPIPAGSDTWVLLEKSIRSSDTLLTLPFISLDDICYKKHKIRK